MQASYALAGGAAAAAARKLADEEDEGVARGADEAEASTSAAFPTVALPRGSKKPRKAAASDLQGTGGGSAGEERVASLRAFAEVMPRRAGVYL